VDHLIFIGGKESHFELQRIKHWPNNLFEITA